VYFFFWKMLKDTALSFIEDEALSRGAAIAFYTVTSVAPVLLIVIAVAALASAARLPKMRLCRN
jgi:membrane protein